MRRREIWFTYPTRDLPHKKVAIRKNEIPWRYLSDQTSFKQLKQKNFSLNLQNSECFSR